MHYDRWRGQWVGQTVSGADGGTTIPADAQAGTADITASNYQQALASISATLPAPASSSTSSLLTPTTLVIGGIAALGLIWFLTKR